MSRIQFKNISKNYGTVEIISGFNLEIKDGEFMTFLGPSGCGKTTCLRIVAGLETNSGGQIYIDDDLVSDPQGQHFTPPEKRHVGMVFQSYAVWPHMSVFENVAYPLRIKKVSKEEIRKRVTAALALTEMEAYAERMPAQLSGGQQQRVALARGLVMEPRVLLLDEPLSNLDAKLREKMRKDIRALQQALKLTVIYVTHDQIEAMTMSDRITVMDKGRILQTGSPQEIREKPANQFVADFVRIQSY